MSTSPASTRSSSAPAPTPSHRAIAWLDPEQAELVRGIGEIAGLRFVGAGTESRGRSAEVALSLGTAPVDDLRAALATASFEGADGIDLVLLAGPGGFGADASSGAEADREAVRTCRERGIIVASLEPMPASVLAFAQPTAGSPEMSDDESGRRGGGAAALASFTPRLRASKRFRELGEVLNDFGAAPSLQVESLCRRGEGSLGARLYDAIDAVRWLMGDAETVHAAYESAGSSSRDLPTDTLGGVHGTMSVNLQFGDGRMAHIFASDAAPLWSRRVTLLGDGERIEAGSLRIGDEMFEWRGSDGTMLDTSQGTRKRAKVAAKRGTRGEAKGGTAAVHARCAEVVGAQVRELVSGRAAPEPPIESARVLATAGAVLLSARTGQAESVATVLRMMGMG